MTQDAFQLLKDTCKSACHERKACANGYRQMLQSDNVSQMMATWRDNWEDVVESKFADIIRSELPKQYPDLKDEMNAAGIYLNECPEGAKSFVKVIITDTDQPVKIHGDARAYVLGNAKVIALNHSQVYNYRQSDAHVMLYDYSFGKIMAGRTSAYNRSTLQCSCDAYINGVVVCDAYGGIVRAAAFRHIGAYRDTVVYSNIEKGISLNGTACLLPLNTNDDEQ
jgi:hypothetical protein